MYIFDKDYPYKLKLLGCVTNGREYEKDIIFIKTHGQVFSVSHYYNSEDETHTLSLEPNFSEEEIRKMNEFGICNKEITLERYYDKNFDIYEVKFPGLAIAIYEDGKEIINCEYFSLQPSTNMMIASLYDMELVDANAFINFLKGEL